jgi:hypothetical protein
MGKNKVEVYLGGVNGERLFTEALPEKVEVKPDIVKSPVMLFNRSHFPVEYKYDGEIRILSPFGKAKLGDSSRLDKDSLHKMTMTKKL